MGTTYVVIAPAGTVVNCVTVDYIISLHECYPEHTIREREGIEDIGWTFDGMTFTEPA